MKKFSLPLLLDSVFIAFSAFLLALFTFTYFIPYPFVLIAAGVFAGLLTLAGVKFLSVKRYGKLRKREEEKEYAAFITQINFMPEQKVAETIIRAVKNAGFTAEKKKDFIYIPQKNLAVFFVFGYEEVKRKDVVRAASALAANDNAIIVSEKFSQEISAFAARFDGKIQLSDGRSFFTALKKFSALPEITCRLLQETKVKPKPVKNILNKKRAKNYLVFGIVFLAMSYFVPIKIYYVICGTIMLVLALVVRFFGIDEKN